VLLVTCLAVALVLAAPSSAAVRTVAFTGSATPNDYVTLAVRVSPRARCTIKVVYHNLVAKGKALGPKAGSLITWRWKVARVAHPGRWPVTVDCGKSGKLSLTLRVRVI
jgi:hypothetical protein